MKLSIFHPSILAGAILLAACPALVSAKLYTPPSTPGNFHVTATTESGVTFAWTASKPGSSGSFVYVIFESNGLEFNVGTGTTATLTTVSPGATYSFYIEAQAGTEASAPSPAVTVTIPAPPPPPPIQPAAPVISNVSVTPDEITVSWTESTPSNELDGFSVLVDGQSAFNYGVEIDGTDAATATEWTILNLTPNTTYSIAVIAESTTGQQTESAPLNVTTSSPPPGTTPPTAPTDLTGWSDGGGEAIVSWNPSTSTNTPQADIVYRIYVNGIHEVDADTVGQTTEVYVFPDGAGDPQPIYVVAVDQYGNVSPPSNILSVEF